ncbi:HPr family phosphocarrier protein [Salmonella enterica]|nr:HPr family phosphocarrier protein [Salmonella enterica]
MPRFAANLSMMFTEVPFIERFAAARKAGFNAVEFLFPYDYSPHEIRLQLSQNNLMLALFNTAPGNTSVGEWGLSALPGREQDAHSDIDLALEYALALNCEQVHVMAGIVPAGEDAGRCREVFINNLRYAADCFAHHNKRVLIEALSPGVKPGYLFSSQYQALDIVKDVSRENVFIQLDTFHAQKVDGNLTHLIRDYAGKYAHVQIAGLPERHEPDDGEINYPWLYDLLDKTGYTGWIGCEYIPRADTLSGLGWFARYASK